MAASVWAFLTCTQLLIHVTTDGGCMDTVRESALNANSGEKHPLPHQGLEPASVLHLAFSWMLYPVSYPHLLSSTFSRDHRIHLSPSLISLMVSVDVKHHVYLWTKQKMADGHDKGSSLQNYRRDGIDKPVGDLILPHLPHNVKLCCSWLGDCHVCYFLQLKR